MRTRHALIPAIALAIAAMTGPARAAAAAAPPWRTLPPPKVPAGADVSLLGVSMAGPSDGWVTGIAGFDSYTAGTPGAPSRCPTPKASPGDHRMLSVAAYGHGQLVAVGYTHVSTQSRAVYSRWNGRSWSVLVGAHSGDDTGSVTTDGKRLWAAGSTGDDVGHPLIQVSH